VPFTVVVVLHGSAAELAALLRSLDAHLPQRPQVVVVDAGPPDGGADAAATWGAEVLERPDAAGFGAANNAGVERARHDVTVLVNPDCELLDGSLAALAERARARRGALHAPRLLDADGSVQRSAHPLPGTVGALAGAAVHPPLLPRALRERLEPWRAEHPRTVGWAIAACLAADTAALRRLGPFDPAAHLFAEDMELCLRARAAGMPTVLHPDLLVRHVGGHATRRAGEPFDVLTARRRAVVGATRGRGGLALDDLAQALTFASRAAGHALLGGDARRPARQLAALARARTGARDDPPHRGGARGGRGVSGAPRGGPLPATAAERGAPVLAIAAAGVLGGAERVLLDWLAAVERPVLLACPPGALRAAADAAGLRVVPLPGRPLRRRGRSARAGLALAALGRDVARLAAAHRPAVVVASGARPLLASAAAPLAGARLLALLHDLPPGGSPRPVAARDPASAAVAAALRAAAARADAIVATSGAIARAADPGARRAVRTHVIHPGVDPDHWTLLPAPPGPPQALWLGALVPWKRADLALEIAARIPDLRLDLAGAPLPGDPPAHEAEIRARAGQPDLRDRVRLLGAVDDPRTALANAQVLLHTADREPFGLALVEALAAGRPVVAPAAGGPLEIVTPACGRLYAPGDATAGAAALRALLADPAAPAAARARAAAFDRRAAAARFAAVVEGVAVSPR
jgi:glycosyltransferase involved in cell wall biosynthesis/GT2 family glycosyltransferase